MAVKIFDAPYGDYFGTANCHTEYGDGFMRNGQYFFSSEKGDWLNSDWLIVHETPYACFYTDIPRERRILFTMEPPEIRKYENFMYYLEQFGTVIAIRNIPGYSGRLIVSNPHIAWSAGIHGEFRSVRDIESYGVPAKNKTISIITSLKQKTEYHRKRVKFLHEAQREFAGVLDSFGREFNPVNDKLDAIAPYKYHIVIENSRVKNYWTEKLADAWAGWALPIYCGDPAILEQIPDKNGIEIIDVDDVKSSLAKIHRIIESDIYSQRLEAIEKCRKWMIKASNSYELVCSIIESSHDTTPKLSTPELFRVLTSTRKNTAYSFMKSISPKTADYLFEAYYRKKGRFWE